MNFLLLCMQSSVCVVSVIVVKQLGIVSFSSFRWKDARAWFPISFLLVTVIYTGSKSLVSRIYKHCKFILILYTSTATLKYTLVHNIQKPNDHSHCKPFSLYCSLLSEISLGIWRSHLVWWQSDDFDFCFVYLHGMQTQKSTFTD